MIKKVIAILFSIVMLGANASLETMAKQPVKTISNGTYQISSAIHTKLVFDESVNITDRSHTKAQKWDIKANKAGRFTIRNLNSNRVLSIKDNTVRLLSNQHSLCSQWYIKKTSSGYKIISAQKKNTCLSVKNWSTGATVALSPTSDSSFQNWNLSTTSSYTGPILSTQAGTIQGPSGKETYYNLDMSGVVHAMKERGIDENYWIREDGVKMYGDYVMVAAELDSRPYGTLVETSLGMGMVVDTGGFAANDPTQLDIATNW